MSATLPARLGEPSRALIVARRLGRARETLPVVLGNDRLAGADEPARAALLGVVMFSSVELLDGHHGLRCIAVALAPVAALRRACWSRPALVPRAADSRRARFSVLTSRLRAALVRVRDGARIFRRPRVAAAATRRAARRLGAAADVLLLPAHRLGSAGSAWARPRRVLFAVNATAVIPARRQRRCSRPLRAVCTAPST